MALLDRTITAALVFLIFFTPIAFGSVHPWAYSLMEAVIFLMVLIWAARIAISGGASLADFRIRGHVVSLALFIAFVALQLLPLPPSVLKIVSPSTYEVYTRSLSGWPDTAPYAELLAERGSNPGEEPALNAQNITNAENQARVVQALPRAEGQGPKAESAPWMPLSLAPELTKIDLLKLTAYGCLFFLLVCYPFGGANPRPSAPGARYMTSDPRAEGREPKADPGRVPKVLLYAILMSGLLVAALGFVNLFTWNGKVLWFLEPYDAEIAAATRAASPFINPDHFAGYLALVFPLMITGAVYRTFLTPRRAEAPFRIFCAFGVFIMFCSLLLSLSRGGWSGAALGVTVLFLFAGGRSRANGSSRVPALRRVSIAVVALAVVTAILYVGPRARQHLDLRLSETVADTDLAGRATVWREAAGMIPDFPLLGVGLGAWPEAFPRYKSPENPIFWREAHNDYLEILSETGVIGFLLFACFVFLCLRPIVRSLRNPQSEIRSSPNSLPIFAAFVAGMSALAFHEFFDFNLQIPANAFLFTVLLALSLRMSVGAATGLQTLAALPSSQERLRNLRETALPEGRGPRAGGRTLEALAMGLVACLLILTAFRQERLPYPHNLIAAPPASAAEAIELVNAYPAQSAPHLSLFALLQPLANVAEPPASDSSGHEKKKTVSHQTVTDARATPGRAGSADPERLNREHELRALRAAVWLDPNNTTARDLLAALLLQEGHSEEGLRQITRSIQGAPSMSAHFYLAPDFQDQLAAPEERAIEEGFKKAIAARRQGALDGLGSFYDRMERFSDGAELYEGAAARTDDLDLRMDYLLRAAARRLKAGELEQGRDLYLKAAKLRPRDPRPYNELISNFYAPQNEIDEAREMIIEAIKSGADGFPLYLSLADLAREAGDADIAVESLMAARGILDRNGGDDNFDRYVALWQAARKAGDRDLAQSVLRKAADVGRPTFRTFYRLGGIYAQDSDFDRAAYYYRKATRLDPRSATGFYRLALAEEHSFNFDAARKAYMRALELDSDNDNIRHRYERFEEQLVANKDRNIN